MVLGCSGSIQSDSEQKRQFSSQFIRVWKSEKPELADLYEGKWKVTGLIDVYYRARSDYFPQHYLGRTVIIGDKTIETSIWYWPFELDWCREDYDYAKIAFYNYDSQWIRGYDNSELIYDIWGTQELPFVIFYSEEGTHINHVILLEKHKLAYHWMGGYYLLEPFSFCDENVEQEDIIGEWTISFLDSYDSDYEGGFVEIEETKRTYEERMNELNGSDFYAQDWLGEKIAINEDSLIIGNQTIAITGFREEMVSREVFEEEWDIHDGLSIYDDIIKVVYIECSDGIIVPVVPVNEGKIIIQIELGWFVLEHSQN